MSKKSIWMLTGVVLAVLAGSALVARRVATAEAKGPEDRAAGVKAAAATNPPAKPEANRPEDLLPDGAEIYTISHVEKDGTMIYSRPAVYESDLDGDGVMQTLIFYTFPHQNMPTLHVAIVKPQPGPVHRQPLVQTLELGGTYFWPYDRMDQDSGIKFLSLGRDKKYQLFIASAMSASCGASIELLSHDAAGRWALSEDEGSYEAFNLTETGFKGRPLHDKAWSALSVKQDKQGRWRFVDQWPRDPR